MKYLSIIGVAVLIFIGVWYTQNKNGSLPIKNTQPQPSYKTPSQTEISLVSVIAQNLDTPWAIAFLPDKSMLVTERAGRVRFVDQKGVLASSPVLELKDVREIGEGGLLGIAIHPNFSKNRFVYLYYTYAVNDGIFNKGIFNKVVRFKYGLFELAIACFDNDPNCNKAGRQRLEEDKIIIDKIPSAPNHNGGRIKFGPDGFLYITTGDAQNPSQSQNVNALAGKILRVTDEGKPAPDNPFHNAVYSYGHRNPQGIAWDSKDQLWEVEHGQSATDELNLIQAGKNYGWPIIRGNQEQSGMLVPRLHSGTDTWAPGDLAYNNNFLYFVGLRGQALYRVDLHNQSLVLKEYFKNEFGRIREVVLGPDNMLYITTSNRDGRGNPQSSDDKIIKINPQKLD